MEVLSGTKVSITDSFKSIVEGIENSDVKLTTTMATLIFLDQLGNSWFRGNVLNRYRYESLVSEPLVKIILAKLESFDLNILIEIIQDHEKETLAFIARIEITRNLNNSGNIRWF